MTLIWAGPKLCVLDVFFGRESRNLSSLPELPTLLSNEVGGDSERAIPLAREREENLLELMLWPWMEVVADGVGPGVEVSNVVSASGGSIETCIQPVGVSEVLKLLAPILSDSDDLRAAI